MIPKRKKERENLTNLFIFCGYRINYYCSLLWLHSHGLTSHTYHIPTLNSLYNPFAWVTAQSLRERERKRERLIIDMLKKLVKNWSHAFSRAHFKWVWVWVIKREREREREMIVYNRSERNKAMGVIKSKHLNLKV
jgi:hypothetical protein